MGDFCEPCQWIEIDAGALTHNLAVLKGVLGKGVLTAAVVKANAYGHGIEQVAGLAERGADWMAVHSAGEARTLRDLGVAGPVLIMGFVPPSEMTGLGADDHILVSTEEALVWLGNYREKTGHALPVHLKVETGTNRQGVPADRISGMCRLAAAHGLDVVGIATHFANIEDTLEHEFAQTQLAEFRQAVEAVTSQLGGRPPFIHAACSAAALLFREADFSLVRVGISMYGHWPSRETRLSWMLEHGRNGLGLQPALTWRALVGQTKEVAVGATVGYGRTWRALRPTRLAVLPVGYADGYPRTLGNRARVLVHGVPAPVVGRVCMNVMMIDVTDVPEVAVGDPVVLLGTGKTASITAEELAALSGTINYELLARLSPTIPRRVVGG